MKQTGYATGDLPFPPYGVMTHGFQQGLADPAQKVPKDFLAGQSNRDAAWTDFMDGIVGTIANTLWPVWDMQAGAWAPSASRQRMVALTVRDLEILAEMQNSIFDRPTSALRAGDCPTHEELFRNEDSVELFTKHLSYDSTLDAAVAQPLSGIVGSKFRDKCATATSQIKLVFQRPRPYQMAVLLAQQDIFPRRSTSAGSPSLCSGHGLQGFFGTGAVMEHLLANVQSFSAASWEPLRQHSVDIGDRRVLAGLHHPSDSLALWMLAMRLADYVFSQQVKAHLWRAVSRQSLVFRRIENEPLYADAVAELRQSAANVASLADSLP